MKIRPNKFKKNKKNCKNLVQIVLVYKSNLTKKKREIHQTKLQKTRLEDQIELLHSKKSEQSRNQEEDEAIYAKIQEEFDALKGQVDELDTLIKELREERSALEIHVKQSEAARTQAQHQLQDQLKIKHD